MENKSNQRSLEKVSHLLENHTDVKTEATADTTTFITMAYILAVNPNILSAIEMDGGVVFMATALAPLVAILLVAAFANYSFMLAPDMGLGAYFTYTVIFRMGHTWQMVLAVVSVEGFIFVVLFLTSVREAIFNATPMSPKHIVSAGTGLFVAFIGLQNAKIVVKSATPMSVFSFKGFLDAGVFSLVGITVLLALIGILIIGTLVVKNIKGSILWDILTAQTLGVICEVTGLCQPNAELGMSNVLPNLSGGLGIQSMAPTFFKMDFSGILPLNFATIMFAFLFVDMLDTLGTLTGVASKADMLDRDGKLPKIRGALPSDAIGISLGAVFGISTTTAFVESVSGVAEGGGTGLASVVAAISFGPFLFLSPISSAIPSSATAPALIVVSLLMISSISEIDFNNFTGTIPSYIATATMPFMYNISEGIAMGVISYAVINVAAGHTKEKKISLPMYILAILSVLKYVLI